MSDHVEKFMFELGSPHMVAACQFYLLFPPIILYKTASFLLQRGNNEAPAAPSVSLSRSYEVKVGERRRGRPGWNFDLGAGKLSDSLKRISESAGGRRQEACTWEERWFQSIWPDIWLAASGEPQAPPRMSSES